MTTKASTKEPKSTIKIIRSDKPKTAKKVKIEKEKVVQQYRKGVDHLLSPEDRNCLIPKVTCLFSDIIASFHSVKTSNKIITTSREISHRQVVVACGPNSVAKVGDWIGIKVGMFPKEVKPGKHDIGNTVTVRPPTEKIGGTEYLFISDRHIKYIIDK